MAISPQENGAGDQSAGGTGPVLINDQFLVDVNTPISELDMPSAKAYAVRDRRNQEITRRIGQLWWRLAFGHRLHAGTSQGCLPLRRRDT